MRLCLIWDGATIRGAQDLGTGAATCLSWKLLGIERTVALVSRLAALAAILMS